jgi:uncharacterized membrane protein YcaP (DUF421 family)
MELFIYLTRALTMLLITWLALRIIGKKSIAQMTSYELAGIMLLTTVAAEPLVYKIVTKAAAGTLFIALIVLLLGALSLRKKFYNADMRPDVIIMHGKINKTLLKKNKMNISLLMSMLRLKGYADLNQVDYAIIEPNGQVSVFPKVEFRPVQPSDMQISPQETGLPLPLILDGEIQYNNIKYAGLTTEWLSTELRKAGAVPEDILMAQVNLLGQLSLCRYSDQPIGQPPVL